VSAGLASCWKSIAAVIDTNRAADDDAQLRQDLIELARQKPRFGYRRLGALLEQRGHKGES
jgi:hypothetical protein